MAELSRESGVAIATIKYYQREGLLPPGELTSPNQARYGAAHVRRLKLVRALADIAGLSVAGIREVLAAIDEPRTSLHDVLGSAQPDLPATPAEIVTESDREWAAHLIDTVAAERGWRPPPHSPPVEALTGVLCTYRAVGHEWALEGLSAYAESADRTAVADIDALARLGGAEDIVEGAVVGTVLGDALLAALRRVAHTEASRTRFGDADRTCPPTEFPRPATRAAVIGRGPGQSPPASPPAPS